MIQIAPRRALVVLTSACLLVLSTALIASAGPFTDQGTQPPLDFGISPAINCAPCHGNYDTENNIEPYNTWVGSMMAQASRDPLFWAALDVANNDVPGIGDWCLRCHVPKGWFDGRSEPPNGSVDGCGFDGKLDEYDNDFSGISCHVCHRMTENSNPPPGEEPWYLENGQMWIDDSNNCPNIPIEPCRYGPYDYPADGVPPPHAWEYSSLHSESRFCANCHNVTSPAHNLIIDGVDQGIRYPIERTSREWSLSGFALPGAGFESCQDCHMPQAENDPAYACVDQTNNHFGNMKTHQLAGGNAWIPDVLRGEYPNLGMDAELSATRDWALEMLQNRSATMALAAPDTVSAGAVLNLSTRVTNLTGHKLPTGYPEGRRMWIDVEVRDGDGALVFASGAYDVATGVLTEDGQLKEYSARPGIWNQNGTGECDDANGSGVKQFHFVLNNCYALDNRIPPAGFTGGNDLETQPVNYTYPETSPGSGVLVNYDDTAYSFTVPPGTVPPLTATTTLLYQTVSKDYIEFLRDEAIANSFPDDCIERSTGFPTMSRGELMYDMWERYDRSAPIAMATDEATIWVGGTVGVDDPAAVGPVATRLLQSSPNPLASSSSTSIPFTLATDASVELAVFDVAGRHVRTLASGRLERGEHRAAWDGLDERGERVGNGVYFYRLAVDGKTETRRLVVLR